MWQASAERILLAMSYGEFGAVINTQHNDHVAGLLDHNVVLEMDGLSSASDRAMFSEALTLYLYQHLNAPVSRGDLLFEIAPLDEYRVVLQVDERDVGSIEVGQQGHLALAGLSGETLPMTVQKITPTATSEEGLNYFRGEARLDEGALRVRHGMEGVGKIEMGSRRQLWIYTHKLVRWWKLWSWAWLP